MKKQRQEDHQVLIGYGAANKTDTFQWKNGHRYVIILTIENHRLKQTQTISSLKKNVIHRDIITGKILDQSYSSTPASKNRSNNSARANQSGKGVMHYVGGMFDFRFRTVRDAFLPNRTNMDGSNDKRYN